MIDVGHPSGLATQGGVELAAADSFFDYIIVHQDDWTATSGGSALALAPPETILASDSWQQFILVVYYHYSENPVHAVHCPW